jgi:hypothetical protein
MCQIKENLQTFPLATDKLGHLNTSTTYRSQKSQILVLRSNAGFFDDLPASIVLFNLALNLKGVAERKKTVFPPTYFLQSSSRG